MMAQESSYHRKYDAIVLDTGAAHKKEASIKTQSNSNSGKYRKHSRDLNSLSTSRVVYGHGDGDGTSTSSIVQSDMRVLM